MDEAGGVVVELVLRCVALGHPRMISFGFAIPDLGLAHLDCHVRDYHGLAIVISLRQVHLITDTAAIRLKSSNTGSPNFKEHGTSYYLRSNYS